MTSLVFPTCQLLYLPLNSTLPNSPHIQRTTVGQKQLKMASLSSQLPLQPSQENPPSNYSIYASFCCRDASPNTNMSIWIECYSPSINAWHRITRIPGLIENHVLKGFSMASIGDSIYIIGGRLCHKLPGHVHDELDLEVRSSVLRYNVRDNEWHKCASLSTPRFDFACTVSDNKIYVAGGEVRTGMPAWNFFC